MGDRRCLTCKHFEPSPIRRKGWCRNSLLYAPHQSHLVRQDDLDCGHRLGNYWEPADPSDEAESVDTGAEENPEAAVLQILTSSSQSNPGSQGPAPRPAGGSGSPLGSGGSVPNRPSQPPGGRGGGGGTRGPYGGGPERGTGYQPDERYWTDYLRIAFPVIGILLMLGLFWFWANELIGDDNNNTPTPTVAAGLPPGPTATTASGATSPPVNEVSPTVDENVAPTETTEGNNGTEPTRTPRSAEPSPTPDGGSTSDFAEGDKVTTIDDGVRLRSDPESTADNVVVELSSGTSLTVTGPTETDAEGNQWVPVDMEDGTSGYVSADLIELS